MKAAPTTLGISPFVLTGCAGQKQSANDFIQKNTDNVVVQETLQTDTTEKSGETLNPRTIDEEGNIHCIPIDDWCLGPFPDNIRHTHELTGDKEWLPLAEKYMEAPDSVQYLTRHHDVGFMISSSYLNGYRFANKEKYKPAVIQTIRLLSTRFRPNPGVIQSRDVDRGWQAKRGWKYPVIIDDMMNLELMFEATRSPGNSTFYDIARKHADTTMANHFRVDNSCYHIMDHDPETGEVRKKQTAQGYADESVRVHGQARALHGYTICYRYTYDVKYLRQAEKIHGFIFSNKNLPEDLVPYWDFDAPKTLDESHDAPAAAYTAPALYELSTYIPGKGYKEKTDKIMESLASPAYRAEVGINGNFILMHSVGSIPHGVEIDVPLNYADYYLLEALMRKRDLEK